MYRTFAATAALSLALGIGSYANAATILTANGTPLTYQVYNFQSGADGNALVLQTNPSNYLVDYSSSSLLHINGSSGGFAKVSGAGGAGGAGFADLTIDPENPILGFSAIKFNLVIPSSSSDQNPPNNTDWTFDTRVYFQGGGFQDFLNTPATSPDRFIVADLNQVISKIVLSDLEGIYNLGSKGDPNYQTKSFNFAGIEQVSFNAVIGSATPEPSTWAMMMVGVFGMGQALRKRRTQGAVAVQA